MPNIKSKHFNSVLYTKQYKLELFFINIYSYIHLYKEVKV